MKVIERKKKKKTGIKKLVREWKKVDNVATIL